MACFLFLVKRKETENFDLLFYLQLFQEWSQLHQEYLHFFNLNLKKE